MGEHRLTRHLADRLPEVQAPPLTRDGASFFALGDRGAWLLPLIPAERRSRLGGVE
jgi:Ser/Thr protein kinase RdoA (MazF antagonist)